LRALVKTQAGPGLEMVEVPQPSVGPDEVSVKVLRTGICGTDVHIDRWDPWAQSHVAVGVTVGHEFVGRVEALGPGVEDLEVGDLVSGEGHLVCGRCRNCRAGRRVMCARTEGVGVTREGCFASSIVLPSGNLWRHQPGIDLEVAAIFDPFGNAVHVATAFEILNEDVAITGAGPIGLMAAIVARHAGARHVVVSDVSPYRLALAESIGATKAVDARSTSLRDTFAALDMAEGFDVGFEMSGNPAALRGLLEACCHGGKVALLGLPAGSVELDVSTVVMNMLTLRGIYGRQMFETWYAMSVLVDAGLDLRPVITHRFDAADWAEAFETVASGECGKVILTWDED